MEKNIETIEPSVRVSGSAGGWFDFSVSYPTTSGEMLSQDEVWSLLRSGRPYQKRSKDGKVLLLDTQAMEEFQEVLVDAQPQQTRGTFRVAQAHASFLEKTFEKNQWSVIREGSGAEGLTSSIDLFQSFKASLPEQTKKIRDYQWQGGLWMQSLFEKGYGGILADDMGLGKTLQVLTWMGLNREIARSKNEEALPCLVICPTSLVFNWVAECLKWMPGLKVLAVEGSGREGTFAQLRQHDVIVTSYALIRRDLPHYRAQHFQTIFLDEAQHIKNRNTQNAQAVKAVRADHRLVITGTPLENSVLDLWSVFDFLMPGYLGAAKDFKERYEQPILQGGTASLQRLKRRVSPFLLRRTKEVVRPEIPERLDHVLYCELSPEQRAVYQQVM
ncbi:MAG: SNF2-related protein, partial [Roseibacillus sp.]|nr:SNF2-related protein [Roseibacillus sp.]